MRGGKLFFLLFSLWAILALPSCASKPKTSVLLRDPISPPPVVQETFAKEGKSDYILQSDEGYSFRLIYLCENRVYNFMEEPAKNPVLVSLQPILDTPVEQKLSADDRRRIWACMERRVREELSRVEELTQRVTEQRMRLAREIRSIHSEQEQILAEREKKRQLDLQKQRRIKG